VVCAHGYSGNARDFDFLARELAGGARVLCPDVAGRGESDRLALPLAYHFPQFLADFRSTLAYAEAEEVDWVGTSMGGLLGLMHAAQPGSRIRRLVLNDVGAFVPADGLREIGSRLAAPDHFASLREVEAHLRETHREWGDITDAQFRALARHQSRRVPEGGYRLHYDPQIARLVRGGGLPFVDGLHLWDAWDRIHCPVLVIRGEHSRILPAEVAQRMVDTHPEARLLEIEGAGHAPALMSAAEIDPIRNFLAARGAESTAREAREPRETRRGRPAA